MCHVELVQILIIKTHSQLGSFLHVHVPGRGPAFVVSLASTVTNSNAVSIDDIDVALICSCLSCDSCAAALISLKCSLQDNDT